MGYSLRKPKVPDYEGAEKYYDEASLRIDRSIAGRLNTRASCT